MSLHRGHTALGQLELDPQRDLVRSMIDDVKSITHSSVTHTPLVTRHEYETERT